MPQLWTHKIMQNLFQRSIDFLFAQIFLIASLHLMSAQSFAQSQVEVENEISVGDSDAAIAEDRQMSARLQDDLVKEEESKKAAAISYETNKKKTAQIREHIEEMKIATSKSEKNRQISLDQIKLDQKKLNKLEKTEAEFKAKLAEAQARLTVTNAKRDLLISQTVVTKGQIQKTKDEIVAAKQKEHLAKSEVKTASTNLNKAKGNLAESKKWRDREVKRLSLATKYLNKDQATIEGKIRISTSQIKKLQDEVNAVKKRNALASENHERAAALKNENDLELTRLQKLKRTPASKATKPKAQ